MSIARTKRLFRPNLTKFTQNLVSVERYAKDNYDPSWIWLNPKKDQASKPNLTPGGHETVFLIDLAPEQVKRDGVSYAKWCIFFSALSFQVVDFAQFAKATSLWWGAGKDPSNKIPSTDDEWSHIFGSCDPLFIEARKKIFIELMKGGNLELIAQAWCQKIKLNRSFNMADALNMAALFPKSFSDSFLFKAQRAIFNYTQPFLSSGQTFNCSLSGGSDLSSIMDVFNRVGFDSIIIDRMIKSDVFLRDEVHEKSIRSFLILNQEILGGQQFGFSSRKLRCETTDY